MSAGPPSKDDLSSRCTATLHFPAEPYHNLRCTQKPHTNRDLHVAKTTVPTERPGQHAGHKPAMADVILTWNTDPMLSGEELRTASAKVDQWLGEKP